MAGKAGAGWRRVCRFFWLWGRTWIGEGWSWYRIFGALLTLAALCARPYAAAELPGMVDRLLLVATLALVGASFGYQFFAAPYVLWGVVTDEAAGLRERIRPRLRLSYEETEGASRWDEEMHAFGNRPILTQRAYRVRVQNLSETETLDNVSVSLVGFEPRSGGDLPAPLSVMHGGDQVEFQLHPQGVRFVDVAVKSRGPSDPIYLQLGGRIQQIALPPQRYTLVLEASARGVAPERKPFVVDVDTAGNLTFRAASDAEAVAVGLPSATPLPPVIRHVERRRFVRFRSVSR